MDKEEQGHWDHALMVNKLTNEIERLRKQIRYQEHRDGQIGTHDPVCYAYGPSHYECALREIERVRELLKELQLSYDAVVDTLKESK